MIIHPYKPSFREHLKTIFSVHLQTIIYSVNIILTKGERQKKLNILLLIQEIFLTRFHLITICSFFSFFCS